MDTMDNKRKKLGAICVALLALAIVMCAFSANVKAAYTEDDADYSKEMSATYVATAPTLDGSLDDWNMNATAHSTYWFAPESVHREGLIWTAFANDANWLYIAIDLTPDNTTEDNDYCVVALDLNNDGVIDTGNDTQINITGKNQVEAMAGLTGAHGYEKTAQASWKHTVWEFAISIDTIGKDLNDTIRLMMFGNMTNSEWYYPSENKLGGDFPNDVITAKITLSQTPPAAPPAQAGTPTNVLYANYLVIIGILVVLVYMLAFERIWGAANEYYSKGKYWSAVLLSYGMPLLMFVLAGLQYYYDWIHMLFGI